MGFWNVATWLDRKASPQRPGVLVRAVLVGLAAALVGPSDAVGAQEALSGDTPSQAGQQEPAPGEAAFRVEPITLDIAANMVKGSRLSLGEFFMRAARRIMRRQDLEVLHINLALDLMGIAVQLDPDNPQIWRTLLNVASAADPDSALVQETEAAALERLSQLDPADEVIRLRRLLWMIEQQPNAESRLELFQQLLEPDSVAVIQDGVAARLALDMAQLLYRTGDTDGFAERLAQSIELDPSYPRATAMAAGYFGSTSDPITHAELLIAALIADPVAIGFGIELGELALEFGAYEGAMRMLSFARMNAQAGGADSNDLVTALSLAFWGMGQNDKALAAIETRIRRLDQFARENRSSEEDAADESSEQGPALAPIPPSIALVGSALHSISEDKNTYREFVQRSMGSIEFLLAQPAPDKDEATEQEIADRVALLSDAVIFTAWQGEDALAMFQVVKALEEYLQFSPEMLTTFDGWVEIIKGQEEAAIAIFESLEEKGDFALLGLSIAYERTDRKSQAAKLWFELARKTPGTVIGIWCRDKLEKALSTSIPASELAQELNLLIKQIPSAVDRIAMDRGRAYSIRIEPVEDMVGPFDPIRFRVSMTNRSGVPLAIGPEGPIRPTMGMRLTATRATSAGSEESPWIVIPIDNRFEIGPRDVYSFDVNIADFPYGDSIYANPDVGTSLSARMVTNYVSVGLTLAPGPFGEKASSRLMRIDGVTADAPWRRDAVESVMSLDSFKSIQQLALLLHVVALYGDDLDEEYTIFRDNLYRLFMVTYVELPAAVRAWLVSVCPTDAYYAMGDLYQGIVDLFYADKDPLVMSVILAKMTFQVGISGTRSPYFDIAEQAEDEDVASLGKRMRAMWLITEEEQAEEGVGNN